MNISNKGNKQLNNDADEKEPKIRDKVEVVLIQIIKYMGLILLTFVICFTALKDEINQKIQNELKLIKDSLQTDSLMNVITNEEMYNQIDGVGLKTLKFNADSIISNEMIDTIRNENNAVKTQNIKLYDKDKFGDKSSTIRLDKANDFNDYHFFMNDEELILFCKYIKSQSRINLNDESSLLDNLLVIQVMFNRLVKYETSWRRYYDNQSINNSKSIKLMKLKKLVVNFDLRLKEDRLLYNRVKQISVGDYSVIKEDYPYDDVILPANVLYFESFKRSPNRGVHKKKNMFNGYFTVNTKHKFYLGVK